MTPVISIDFGNTYTKVALRPTADSPGELLTDDSLAWDDQVYACVPTLAGCVDRGGKLAWSYGTEVCLLREDMPGLTVHRNWKPRFFEAKEPAPAAGPGDLPPPPDMTAQVWAVVTAGRPAAEVRAMWERLGGGAIEQTDPDSKSVGRGFFDWLRRFFDPVCRARLGKSVGEVPARVSVPSFGSMAGARELLGHVLTDAGWRLDARAPFLHEPLSNVIGTFTAGANATHRVKSGGTFPHYGRMFHATGMAARMREAALADGPKTAWVMIADVGGYTADFAVLGMDLDEFDAELTGTADGRPRLAHRSWTRGVTDLDAAVRTVLPAAKRAALDKVVGDPDQQRLEAFHRNCYGPAGRHALTRAAVVGGTAKEKKDIRAAVERFAAGVADDAEAFLSLHQHDRIDDLILTGGGTMIPAVREALCNRLSHYGVGRVHAQIPANETPPGFIPFRELDAKLVRGATAVGGASVYFDYASA